MTLRAEEHHALSYSVQIDSTPDLALLEAEWIDIEKKAEIPFFLTWSWVSTWIKVYKPALICIKALLDGQVVAIGLLTSSVEKRHFVINAKQIRLMQTGNLQQDQIWMEYNDFIAYDEHKETAVNTCLKQLYRHKIFHQHDEILISMMLKNRAKSIVKNIPKSSILFNRPSYGIDLQTVRSAGTDYIQTLKPNTRYQIRRSIREYEKIHGPVKLHHAQTSRQAQAFFNEAGPFHIQRWYDSGYKNPEFLRFHHQLIEDYYDQGNIHVTKVMSGDTVIAVLYYLVHQQTVSFYLHGLKYENNKKLKPGLVAHALATQYFIDTGMHYYDYMGGYSQYKTQLAQASEEMSTLRIQKPVIKFILENTAQKLKHLIVKNDH